MTSTRERIALAWPPMLLRAALAITFIWAGAGKVFHYEPLTAAEATTLGLNHDATPTAPATTTPATPATPSTKDPAPAPDAPIAPLPPGDKPVGSAANSPTKSPAKNPATKSAPPKKDSKDPAPKPLRTDNLATREADPAPPDAPPADASPALQNPDPPVAAFPIKQAVLDAGPVTSVRALYKLALMLHTSGLPDPAGKTKMALVPATLAGGDWPVRMAWAVASVELIGGVMVLAGMLTRLWALGMVVVMAGAIWLVDIGPAIASGTAVLGFLPSHPPFSMDWHGPLWRLSLLFMAAALVFAGPGMAALDNALFGGAPPAPPKPAPKPA